MKDLTQLPDPTKHKYISFAKSFVRIIAGASLVATAFNPFHYDSFIVIAGALLIGAEVLGIVEEIV